MKRILIILLFLIQIKGYACNICSSTTQHKSFPVGLNNNNFYSVDFTIKRADYFEKNNELMPKIIWTLTSFISKYNFDAKLINKKEFDKKEIISKNYLSLIKSMYLKGFNYLKDKKLEYFETDYISFCNYQKKCKKLSFVHDTISKKDYFIFKNRKVEMDVELFIPYEERSLKAYNLLAYFISSIRIFKSKKFELIVPHLESGHEISMGWITNDPNKKLTNKYDQIIYMKEEKPKFNFSSIKNSIYQEPLLHHGYGFDFLMINKIQL